MEFDHDQLRIKPNSVLNLSNTPTDATFGISEEKATKACKKNYKAILKLQDALYAGSDQSLLIVLQAMDAAGKDSTIRKLTSNMNVQGCHVAKFGKPTDEEMAHDFLWRIHKQVPEQGHITLFNRSHYEDVLIVKVHNWASEDVIQQRYQYINHFESLLADKKTKVIKFMLHVSPEYQLSRFRRRLEKPEKNWKFNPGDLDERRLWDDYMQAFEAAMQNCSTEKAPWYVIPAENRWFRDFAISQIVKTTLENMDPKYPKPDFDTSLYKAETLS